VDKSLEGKLKCLIFVPVISNTYCDTKSFAWQQEFCVFNEQAGKDPFGMDIRLENGNVGLANDLMARYDSLPYPNYSDMVRYININMNFYIPFDIISTPGFKKQLQNIGIGPGLLRPLPVFKDSLKSMWGEST